MEITFIQSRQNPKIIELVKLKEAKERKSTGFFVIEGIREIERAYQSGWTITELYFCEEQIRREDAKRLLTTLLNNNRILAFQLSESAFEKASYRERPEGIIAVAKAKNKTITDLDVIHSKTKNPLYLIIESIEKPGNLGALLRTADSSGCNALICCNTISDIYNPNAIRASQGTVFSIPIIATSNQEIAQWLNKNNINTFATTPHATKTYWDCNFKNATAILMGSEASGLSNFWLNETSNIKKITIPQKGLADSLNVSMAAAICLFEILRQRS